jgi:methyl-accepting chemotaxis protein/methyl-accepting chemotaxis protein-1 (serine sensor receptor)
MEQERFMTSQMTIGKKLMLAFGIMLALVIGLGYSSLSSVGNLAAELDKSANKTAKKTEMAGQMHVAVIEMRAGQRGLILFSMMKEPAKAQSARQAFQTASAHLEKLVADIRPLLSSDRGREAVSKVENGLVAWKPLYQEVELGCANQKYEGALTAAMDKTVSIAQQMQDGAGTVMEIQQGYLAAASKDAEALSSRSRWIAMLLIGLCVAVGAGVVFMVRQISSTLRQIAGEMGDGADQVAAAASQVSSSSQSLAQGSSEQAASIEETSASSEEINSMSRKNAENSKVAADSMVEAAQRVDEANRNLEQMVTSMNEINASSDKISKIIKVIDEIAFQTNILALNAAVEAARAGEAGMGFAVVADEVRNLAQRCAQAAKDTAGLIEESIAKSNDGKTKLDQVATAVRSITDVANKVKTLVDEVKLGSEEQARGIEQVAKAITQMEKVTQTTAANAEESASASEELSAQSDTLRAIVARLNGMVGGGSSETGGGRTVREHRRVTERRPAKVAALAPAISKRHNMSDGGANEPASVGVHADKTAFPMEGDFKEF